MDGNPVSKSDLPAPDSGKNAGRIVSRETLAREVWQEIRRATPLDNVIDVHIARLRRKIDDGFKCRLIHTVRGLGFVLREEPDT